MKQVVASLPFFHRSTHGYFAAKPHFKGELVREIFVTVFDKEKQETAQGFLFLTKGNVLLTLLTNAGQLAAGVHEFTEGDTFSVSEAGDLTEMLNQTASTEKNLTVSTSHKVAFVTVNGRYQILHGIQVARTYGHSQLNWKTVYLVGDDYVEQTRALRAALADIVTKKPVSESKLPGLKASVAQLNIYISAVATVGVIMALLYVLYLLLTGNLTLS